MPRYQPEEPEEDDEFDDELPDGVYHDGDELPTIACPYCKEPVLEEAQYCPRCENYLSKEDAPRSGYPMWIRVLLIVVLAMSVLTLVL